MSMSHARNLDFLVKRGGEEEDAAGVTMSGRVGNAGGCLATGAFFCAALLRCGDAIRAATALAAALTDCERALFLGADDSAGSGGGGEPSAKAGRRGAA